VVGVGLGPHGPQVRVRVGSHRPQVRVRLGLPSVGLG